MSIIVQLMSGEIITVSTGSNRECNSKRFRYLLGPMINQDPSLITLFLKESESDKSDEKEFIDLTFCEKIRPGNHIYAIVRDREHFYFRYYKGRFRLFFEDGEIVKSNTYIPYGSNIYVEIDTYWQDLRIAIMNYRMRIGYYSSSCEYENEEYDRHFRGLGSADIVESYINDILKIDTPESNIYF
jgi:hypothetical protein